MTSSILGFEGRDYTKCNVRGNRRNKRGNKTERKIDIISSKVIGKEGVSYNK